MTERSVFRGVGWPGWAGTWASHMSVWLRGRLPTRLPTRLIVAGLVSLMLAWGAVVLTATRTLEASTDQRAMKVLESNMRVAWHQLHQWGSDARLINSLLLVGDTVVNGDTALVDDLADMVGGTAAIFMGRRGGQHQPAPAGRGACHRHAGRTRAGAAGRAARWAALSRHTDAARAGVLCCLRPDRGRRRSGCRRSVCGPSTRRFHELGAPQLQHHPAGFRAAAARRRRWLRVHWPAAGAPDRQPGGQPARGASPARPGAPQHGERAHHLGRRQPRRASERALLRDIRHGAPARCMPASRCTTLSPCISATTASATHRLAWRWPRSRRPCAGANSKGSSSGCAAAP